MLLFLIIPEALASVLTLISPIIPNTVICLLLIIAIIKLTLTLRLDLDTDPHALLLQIAVTLFYDTGILLRFLAGSVSNVFELKETFFCTSFGILLGYYIAKKIYIFVAKQITPKNLATRSIMAVCIFNAAIYILYFWRKTGFDDGSISVMRYTFQLPELFKLELVIITFIVRELVNKEYKYILILYFVSGLSLCTLVFIFHENGTALMLIYFTLLAGYNLSSGDAKYKSRIWNFITSKIFPLSIGSLFFLGIGILKRILLTKYPIRGAAGELVYGFDDTLFNISSRLSADSDQIQSARESLYSSFPINLQLNAKLSIPYAEAKTSLADYSYVCVAQAFGKLVAPVLFLLFSVLLVIAASKKGDVLAKAAVTILICQIFVQVLGLACKFCFTGVTSPFIGTGGTSAMCSFALFAMILSSLRRKKE